MRSRRSQWFDCPIQIWLKQICVPVHSRKKKFVESCLNVDLFPKLKCFCCDCYSFLFSQRHTFGNCAFIFVPVIYYLMIQKKKTSNLHKDKTSVSATDQKKHSSRMKFCAAFCWIAHYKRSAILPQSFVYKLKWKRFLKIDQHHLSINVFYIFFFSNSQRMGHHPSTNSSNGSISFHSRVVLVTTRIARIHMYSEVPFSLQLIAADVSLRLCDINS